MAEKGKASTREQQQAAVTDNIKQRLNMLDQRLDNIDSMVSAVIERVMSQPITVNVTCPHCGNNVEIALVGNKKPAA